MSAPGARTATFERPTLPILEDVGDGWSPIPRRVIKNLPRSLSPTAVYIVHNIIDETKGAQKLSRWVTNVEVDDNRRPVWARITIEQFAEWCNASDAGIKKALAVLMKRSIVESRVCGQGREYRVNEEALKRLAARPKRTVDRSDKASNGSSLEPGETCAINIDPHMEAVQIRNSTSAAIRVAHQIVENALRVDVANQREGEARVPSAPEAQPHVWTPVHLSPAQVMDSIGPTFFQVCGKVLDLDHADRIAQALGETPPTALLNLVRQRLKRGPVGSGLFVTLAGEAAETHRVAAMHSKPEAPPCSPDTFNYDQANRGTPWGLARDELRSTLTEEEWTNWIGRTAFVRMDGEDLVVSCPDEVTVKFLQQEYDTQIRAVVQGRGVKFVTREERAA